VKDLKERFRELNDFVMARATGSPRNPNEVTATLECLLSSTLPNGLRRLPDGCLPMPETESA
jgi:hypothetical protein